MKCIYVVEECPDNSEYDNCDDEEKIMNCKRTCCCMHCSLNESQICDGQVYLINGRFVCPEGVIIS
jgi:hypothetical protein